MDSTPTTGGLLIDGTYLIAVVYNWTDNKGLLHRSSPSVPLSVTLTGGTSTQRILVDSPTLRLTEKVLVTIDFYRTIANGVILHKESTIATPTFNDKTIDEVTFTFAIADTALVSNEILYTTGGVIENLAPPASMLVTSHQNRLYISGSEVPNDFFFSKEFQTGIGPGFSQDVFIRRVDPEGGAITQISSMDDKFITFKKSRIYFQGGQGPLVTGAANDFTEPQLITTDTGCTEPQSVVQMPLGLMFKGDKGIYLLDRTLSVQYIGAEVEGFNDETITSGTLIDKVNEVRFTTLNGRTLVYNYFFNQWSTFTNYQAKDADLWLETYVHLKPSGLVRREIEDTFLDDGSKKVILLIETAWLKLPGLQGFQRVRRAAILGEFRSDHDLMVSVFYDYEAFARSFFVFDADSVVVSDVYGGDVTYGSSTVYGGSSDNVYQFRAHLSRQKCQAIKFAFQDNIAASANGESFSLSDLSLEIGVKEAAIFKMRANKTL